MIRKEINRRSILLLLTLLLLSQSKTVKAQDDPVNTTQIWLFWHYNHFFKPGFRYIHDIGYRQETPHDEWTRIHYRPGVQYSVGSIVDLTGGVGFWYTIQQILPNSLEIRPWQGVKVNWPHLGRIDFDHYFRLEERFNLYVDDRDAWSFAMRGRYRFNFTIPINNKGIMDNTLFAKINAEFFMDMGKSIEERYVSDRRYTMGLGYRFTPKWRLELLYVIEQSKAFSSEGFKVNSHIIQFRLRTYILPQM